MHVLYCFIQTENIVVDEIGGIICSHLLAHAHTYFYIKLDMSLRDKYPPQQPLSHGQQLLEVSSPSKLPMKDNGPETNFCHA